MKVSNGHEAGVSVTTMKHCYVEKQKPIVESFNKTSAKAFIAAGGKDFLIEPSISKEFMDLFRDVQHVEASTCGDDPETTSKVLDLFENGAKSVGVFFPNEGHFLQKHRCRLVSETIVKILNTKK